MPEHKDCVLTSVLQATRCQYESIFDARGRIKSGLNSDFIYKTHYKETK